MCAFGNCLLTSLEGFLHLASRVCCGVDVLCTYEEITMLILLYLHENSFDFLQDPSLLSLTFLPYQMIFRDIMKKYTRTLTPSHQCEWLYIFSCRPKPDGIKKRSAFVN